MSWRGLFVSSLLVPAAFAVACSASNGDSIPSEVRDAEALDVGTNDPTQRDSSSTNDPEDSSTNPPKDSGANDAKSDGGADASVTSADVRINEIYVNRAAAGGDQAEFVELRGPVGAPVDDLYLRAIDDKGNASTTWTVAPPGTKIGATGTWVLGGGVAVGRIDQTIPAFDGWGLDNTKGAVQLMRGANKELVDVVGWNIDADAGATTQPSTDPTATVEGKTFVLSPTGTDSFGRMSSGDSNDNRVDFCAMAKSAGAANGACL